MPPAPSRLGGGLGLGLEVEVVVREDVETGVIVAALGAITDPVEASKGLYCDQVVETVKEDLAPDGPRFEGRYASQSGITARAQFGS